MLSKSKRRYGWRPDVPDIRDLVLAHAAQPSKPLIDLRDDPAMPPIWDQGQIGSCTGHSINRTHEFERRVQGLPPMDPSRMFTYNNERIIEGTLDSDAGAAIRDGIKAVAKYGVCDSKFFPYKQANLYKKPPAKAYKEALAHKALKYQRVPVHVADVCNVIAGRHLVSFGVTVYESFEGPEVEKTGIVPVPEKGEKTLGGHAMCVVGYDMTKQMFIVANSWGIEFGIKGYIYMPFAYVASSAFGSDYWTITLEAA